MFFLPFLSYGGVVMRGENGTFFPITKNKNQITYINAYLVYFRNSFIDPPSSLCLESGNGEEEKEEKKLNK